MDQESNLKYAYFPGCASKATSKEYNLATKAVCKEIGIELVKIPEFSCCGAGVLKDCDNQLNTNLNARNFALAEKQKLEILTICATCTLNLLKDHKKLKNDKEKIKANDKISETGYIYRGNTDIKHLSWVLVEELGVDKLKEKVKKPLKDFKIAAFYGCHVLRPSEVIGNHDDSEKPTYLEQIIKSTEAKPIDLEGKTSCCGFHIAMIREKTAVKMAAKFIQNAHDNKVDAIVTICPFCQMQFDLYQSKIQKELRIPNLNIPILHFTQLLGLALDIPPKKLGLQKNIVSTKDLLSKMPA